MPILHTKALSYGEINIMNGVITEKGSSVRSQVGFLLLMTGTFYLNFISRIILAPLMPTIEKDLEIGHADAGSLFFLISVGYFTSLMGSGFVSSRITHRKTIILSSLILGVTLIGLSFNSTIWGIRVGCIVIGLAAGLYLPSGVSTLTDMVRPKDWGKAIAIHELAPNVGFLTAPLLSEALLIWISWRNILALLGLAAMSIGLVFARFGRGGHFNGEAPSAANLKLFAREPSFWIMIVFFSLGVSGSLGIYAMLPLFLVSERGMTQGAANYLVAFSRFLALGVAFVSGMVTDKIGPKAALGGVFLLSGFLTILLGVTYGSWLVLIVFMQPMIAVCFFPPGFAGLSKIGPPTFRNILVSFTTSVGFLAGGGAIPTGIGVLGDSGHFGVGLSMTGAMIMGGFLLVHYLRFNE
jgi:MFS transporter, NNP family, nitrate/nitrite transporter